MATGNVILGTATGSIGDVTLMRRAGKQVSRVRVRKIGNPKSANQAANRALLNTLGTAYGYLRGIVDHSFQGKSGRLANMREFFKLNQGIARATGSVSPSGTDEGFNYNFKGETVMRPNPLKIASGTLPEIFMDAVLTSGTDLPNGFKLAALTGTETYAEVLSKLRLQQGDQITICGVADPEFVGPVTDNNQPRSYGDFLYARIILDPADGNLDGAFLTGGAISQPNPRNEGTISFNASYAISLTNLPAENFTAMCVIASRYQDGVWKRSNASFMVADGYESSNPMSEVYESYMQSEEEPVSDLYLNQSISKKVSPTPAGGPKLYYKEIVESESFIVTESGKVAVVTIGGTRKVLNGTTGSPDHALSIVDYQAQLGDYEEIETLASISSFTYGDYLFYLPTTLGSTYCSNPEIGAWQG